MKRLRIFFSLLIALSLSVGSIGVAKADILDEPNYRSETIVVKSYDDSSEYIDNYLINGKKATKNEFETYRKANNCYEEISGYKQVDTIITLTDSHTYFVGTQYETDPETGAKITVFMYEQREKYSRVSKFEKTLALTDKAVNPITVKKKNKTIKVKKLKKKKQKVKVFTIKNAVGVVKYSRIKKGSSKKLKIDKKGRIIVKKKTKKGTYRIKVKVTADTDNHYLPYSKTFKVKIKVK